jgi:hypothetical protein
MRGTGLGLRPYTDHHINRDISPIASRMPSVTLVAQGGLGEGMRVPEASTRSARPGPFERYRHSRQTTKERTRGPRREGSLATDYHPRHYPRHDSADKTFPLDSYQLE